MEDSDSGVSSNYLSSSRASSMSGDDRSTAGSRSSAASLPLSEVPSPIPLSIVTVGAHQSQEPVKVWRYPLQSQATESQVRQLHSIQHNTTLVLPATATNVAQHQQSIYQHHLHHHFHQQPLAPPTYHHHQQQVSDDIIASERRLAAAAATAATAAAGTTYSPLSMPILVPPPFYASDLWIKDNKHQQHKQQQQQQQKHNHRQHLLQAPRYEEEKQVRDWRELEFIEMERHKEMERDRMERERQIAAAAQQERERQEKQSNAEQAVKKHFEESLRRAKVKQTRHVWNLNTLPPQHPSPQHIPHIGISAHVASSPIVGASAGVVGSGVSNSGNSVAVVSSGVGGISSQSAAVAVSVAASAAAVQMQDERRRAATEHDRIMTAERDREIERIRQQEQQQQRSLYAPTSNVAASSAATVTASGILRSQTKGSNVGVTDYLSSHRGLTIGQQKAAEKMPQIKSDPAVVSPHSLYAFNYQVYHKELKNKTELILPTPPPLMSDIKPTTGVIVKHDPHKSSPIQVVHTSKQLQQQPPHHTPPPLPTQPVTLTTSTQHQQQTAHYKSSGVGSGTPTHILYRQAQPVTSERYKTLPTSQQQQSSAQQSHHHHHQQHHHHHHHHQSQQQQQQASHLQQQQHQHLQQHHQHQQQQQQQHQSAQQFQLQSNHQQSQLQTNLYATTQNKPKVSSPAPSHIYGKPSGAGIVSGIPVCRSSQELPVVHVVTKSASPSAFQAHIYVPPPVGPPPPAHSSRTSNYDSRLYQVPAVKQTISHSSSLHGTSPPTASAAPLPISRSPGILIPLHQTQLQQLTTVTSSAVQTQPLDLGVPDRNRDDTASPKRKAAPIHHPIGSPIALDVKKKRVDTPPSSSPHQVYNMQSLPHPQLALPLSQCLSLLPPPHLHSTDSTIVSNQHSQSPHLLQSQSQMQLMQDNHHHQHHQHLHQQQQPHQQQQHLQHRQEQSNISQALLSNSGIPVNLQLAAVTSPLVSGGTTVPISEPPTSVTPKPASEAATGSDVPPTKSQNNHNNNLNVSSGTTATTASSQRPNSVDDCHAVVVIRSSSENSSPAPSPISVPSGPATPAKFSSEPEKSSSPALGAPRHLKKAWLQRHSGEDIKDTIGITGGGSCLKLPLTLTPPLPPPPLIPSSVSSTEHGTFPQSSTSCSTTTTAAVTTTPSATALAPNSSPPVHTSLHTVGSMAMNSISKPKSSVGKSHTHVKKAAITNTLTQDNGHNTDSENKEDSSSSDQDRPKAVAKRKLPKGKRRKGGPRKIQEEKKKKIASESDKESDSDKESMSDKDSDSGTSTSQGKKPTNGSGASGGSSSTGKDKEPRKRGRRPKLSKDEPIRKKKQMDPAKDPFRKPPISQLKKTGESFLQDGPCFEVAPKLAKCRECRWTPNQRSKNTPNIFCRFYAFRRLRYTKNGLLAIAGFSDPHKDPLENDLKLWMPDDVNPPKDLDMQQSRFLLAQVADQFCDLLTQEREAMAEHMSDDKVIAWKRVVQGVREMCDVCETTLFNYHWACRKCGFVVCLDCYKGRKNGSIKIWGEINRERDDFSWLLCTNRAPHEQDRLMLTQIIAGDSLMQLGRKTHETRALWGIPQYCDCSLSKEQVSKATNGFCKELIRNMLKSDQFNGIKTKAELAESSVPNGIKSEKEESKSALSWLADVALQNEGKKNGSDDTKSNNGDNDKSSDSDTSSDEGSGGHSTLRELLIRPSAGGCGKSNGSRSNSPISGTTIVGSTATASTVKPVMKKSKMLSLDDMISTVVDPKKNKSDDEDEISNIALKHYLSGDKKRRRYLPIRIMTLAESKTLYPGVPHAWLCDGKLLRLFDPLHPGNVKLFQEQWKRGQPVLISEVSSCLNMDLWRPESFSKEFGEGKNDLINCITGNLVPNQPMKRFWDGFDFVHKRLKDDKGQPMLLKLKDWPPGEDFAEIMPTRFANLMQGLPLGDYTQRSGKFNLASRLPDCFVKPDLGPKMYNAYGSAYHPNKGTTNLHLDISDAVNVMVYVGIPQDVSTAEEHVKEAFRAIDEAGCDILTRRRVRDKQELPGALWHIYAPRDADKIRDLLNKVAIERGARLEPNHDPIHDQSWYLDGPLRERLYKEYAVEGYPIAQCLGDAVFIPAGAPHQVRNLHNCIKIAEDFVSPENVSHCFQLTQEFRELSDTHSNHEDKLQIKNIIYHAVKDAVACLAHLLAQQVNESQSHHSSHSGSGGSSTVTTIAEVVKSEIKDEQLSSSSSSVV